MGRAHKSFTRLAVVLLLIAALPLLLTWRPGKAQPVPTGLQAPSLVDSEEIVVDLRDDISPQEIAALESRYNVALEYNSEHAHEEELMRATVDPARLSEVVSGLQREPDVEFAQPEHIYTAFYTPNDPRFSEQWNFKMVQAEKAWDIARGKDVIVAVIDTGVAFENDERCYLAKDFKETHFVKGYDYIHDDEHPNDDHGHGTHVAGTIAESTDNGEGVAGLAFEATIMPLKVLNRFGVGKTADIADAIRFAADHGAKVINMSLGSPLPDPIVASACTYAYKKGVVIVCAAGNSGSEGVSYPAAYPECIAVSAVGPTGDLAPYSSWGSEIAIAAPGGDKSQGEQYGILQNTVMPDDGYYYLQGTSMASPHVAATAALVVSLGITDPAEVQAILQRAAQPESPEEKYGAGLLNAYKACELAQGSRGSEHAKLAVSFLAGLACLGIGQLRRRLVVPGGHPIAATLALLLGFLLPDGLTTYFGFDSRFNLFGHSILLPLLLLSIVAGQKALGFMAAMAAGFVGHLLWDLLQGVAPFAVDLAWQAVLWLGTNILVGVGTIIAALQRARGMTFS